MKKLLPAFALLAIIATVLAQNGNVIRQGTSPTGDVNFSNANLVRPFKTGTSLPGTCTVGDMFYKTDATAGQNLYGCTATNTWTQQGGSGSSVGANIPTVTRTSSTVLTVCGNCSSTTPGILKVGGKPYVYTSSATITLNSGSGTVYVEGDSAGAFKAYHNLSVSCSGITCASGSAFDAICETNPLAIWTATSGVWDATTGGETRVGTGSPCAMTSGSGISLAKTQDGVQISATGGGGGGGTTILSGRVTTQFDSTSTTVADVTGLSVTLVTGKVYHFEARAYETTDATGGSRWTMGGTVTPAYIIYQYEEFNNSAGNLTANGKKTALLSEAAAGGGGTTDRSLLFFGTISVTTGGTLTVKYGQSSANGTSSVLVGSSLIAIDITP